MGLYPDNISIQLLIKNGKMSSGKKTKHIKAKFFFIKDRIDNGEIRVLDCPAEEMWADIMTKPLQGTVFRVMRAELMNCPVNYKDPKVSNDTHEVGHTVSVRKRVTWKSEVAAPFKAPQECVRQNSIQANKQRLKGLLRKPRYSQQSTGTQLKNKSTSTRKSTSTQLVWSTGNQLRNRSTGTCKSTSTLLVPSRSTSTPVGNDAGLGTARPVKLTWQVGVSGNKGTKQ